MLQYTRECGDGIDISRHDLGANLFFIDGHVE
ncbi:MAG: H-X9-DG-CTERM domain-containing protein [Lentisphaeria bacterium]